MVRLDAAARQGVDPVLLELVKIRASQLNHCAFCLDMHTKDALAAGESVERIVQLAAWEESRHFYTEQEIAAVELTEAVTVLTDGFVPDEVYRAGRQPLRRGRAGPADRRDHGHQRLEPLRRDLPHGARPLPGRGARLRAAAGRPSAVRSGDGTWCTGAVWLRDLRRGPLPDVPPVPPGPWDAASARASAAR